MSTINTNNLTQLANELEDQMKIIRFLSDALTVWDTQALEFQTDCCTVVGNLLFESTVKSNAIIKQLQEQGEPKQAN